MSRRLRRAEVRVAPRVPLPLPPRRSAQDLLFTGLILRAKVRKETTLAESEKSRKKRAMSKRLVIVG